MLLSKYIITILVTIVSKTIIKPCESIHNLNQLNQVRYSFLQNDKGNNDTPDTVTSGETVDVASNKVDTHSGENGHKTTDVVNSTTATPEVHKHEGKTTETHHSETTGVKETAEKEHEEQHKNQEGTATHHQPSEDSQVKEQDKENVHDTGDDKTKGEELIQQTTNNNKEEKEDAKTEHKNQEEEHDEKDDNSSESESADSKTPKNKNDGGETSKSEEPQGNDTKKENKSSEDEENDQHEEQHKNQEGTATHHQPSEDSQVKEQDKENVQDAGKEPSAQQNENETGKSPVVVVDVSNPVQLSGQTSQSEVKIHEQVPPAQAQAPVTSVNQQHQNSGSGTPAKVPDAYNVNLNNLTDSQKQKIKKFYEKPEGTCSVDCTHSCKSELGGSTQCVSQSGSTVSCSAFQDPNDLTCPEGYMPCSQPNVTSLKSFTLKKDNQEFGALEVDGSNFNDCMGLVLAPHEGVCDKDHLVHNLLFTSEVLNLDYKTQLASDKLTFSNLTIKNGDYKVCLFQRYKPNGDAGAVSEWYKKLLEFLNPTHSESGPLKTVFVLEVGNLKVSD